MIKFFASCNFIAIVHDLNNYIVIKMDLAEKQFIWKMIIIY